MFRDIKRVTSRKVIQNDPAGLKVVEIEQLGETWLLWMHVEFRTRLTVTEDSRDPNNLRTYFELISSVSTSPVCFSPSEQLLLVVNIC